MKRKSLQLLTGLLMMISGATTAKSSCFNTDKNGKVIQESFSDAIVLWKGLAASDAEYSRVARKCFFEDPFSFSLLPPEVASDFLSRISTPELISIVIGQSDALVSSPTGQSDFMRFLDLISDRPAEQTIDFDFHKLVHKFTPLATASPWEMVALEMVDLKFLRKIDEELRVCKSDIRMKDDEIARFQQRVVESDSLFWSIQRDLRLARKDERETRSYAGSGSPGGERLFEVAAKVQSLEARAIREWEERKTFVSDIDNCFRQVSLRNALMQRLSSRREAILLHIQKLRTVSLERSSDPNNQAASSQFRKDYLALMRSTNAPPNVPKLAGFEE